MYALRGMGEYPGYYCYDAQRPSWLPYWIDSVSESLCKWNPKTIGGNIYACATGDPTCGTPTPEQQDPNLSGPGIETDPAAKTNVPKCDRFSSFDPATGQCSFNFTAPSSLIAIGIGIFAMSVLFQPGPRRYGR